MVTAAQSDAESASVRGTFLPFGGITVLRLALGAQAFPGLGWAGPMSCRGLGLRACDGARADELSKDYRALRT